MYLQDEGHVSDRRDGGWHQKQQGSTDNSMVKKVMATTAENLFHLENTVEKLAKVVKAGTSSNSATTTSKTVAGGGKNGGKKRKRKSRKGYVQWDQEEEEEFADADPY